MGRNHVRVYDELVDEVELVAAPTRTPRR
jgi:hypothetical protein